MPPGPGAVAAAAPALRHVFSARVTLASPVEQGIVDGGQKRFIAITGGVVSGPLLDGVVIAGGGDWQTIHPCGLTRVEARYLLRASDGTVIAVTNPGLRVATPEVSGRLAHGDHVEPAEYYFRTTPRFEAPAGNHDWLNRAVFVAAGIRMPDHVLIEFHQVL